MNLSDDFIGLRTGCVFARFRAILLQAFNCHFPQVSQITARRTSNQFAKSVVAQHHHAQQRLCGIARQQVHAIGDAIDALNHPVFVSWILKLEHNRFVLDFLEGQNALAVILIGEEDSSIVVPATTVVRSREDSDTMRISCLIVTLEFVA